MLLPQELTLISFPFLSNSSPPVPPSLPPLPHLVFAFLCLFAHHAQQGGNVSSPPGFQSIDRCLLFRLQKPRRFRSCCSRRDRYGARAVDAAGPVQGKGGMIVQERSVCRGTRVGVVKRPPEGRAGGGLPPLSSPRLGRRLPAHRDFLGEGGCVAWHNVDCFGVALDWRQ